MNASGDGSRSARRRAVRSQKAMCAESADQARNGQSIFTRLTSPWRSMRSTCRATWSPGMYSSVKIPYSG